MSGTTPYSKLPDHCYWSRTHRVPAVTDVDPVVKGAFTITPDMKIATAGSCFAQHMARRLKRDGFNFFVPEAGHPVLPASVAAEFNYGVYSARYGNVYTARQLLQLAQRALGIWRPSEPAWQDGDSFIDPFRPAIQPGGFTSGADLEADRELHLEAVRSVMRDSDVFVFTFGLTEAWLSREDGAVFPVCPGAAGGTFDAAKYEFKNFTVDEIVADFTEFMRLLKRENPDVKVLMTVSPVPLIATAREDQSVICATTYSKAVLRVAAEMLANAHEDAFYFPSYEVITGQFNRGAYYAEDLREVRAEGVDHVMALFMKHFTNEASRKKARRVAKKSGSLVSEVEQSLDLICEEEFLEAQAPSSDAADDAAPEPARGAGQGRIAADARKAARAADAAPAAPKPRAKPLAALLGTPALRAPGDQPAEIRQQVVGLYSFPKSGNTWLRAIIAEITGIPSSGGALQKYVTDTHYGKAMENPWSFKGVDWYFYKSHHKAVLTTDDGDPMMTDKVISIYRHPLDVFLSYLNFVSRNVSPRAGRNLPVQFDKVEDLTPDEMETLFQIWLKHATLFPGNRKFGNVFEAVEGFRKMEARGDAVHVIRYEDLKDDFAGTVEPMINFLGLRDIDLDKVFKGADDRTKQNGKFFWKRAKKNNEKYLTPEQISRFETKYAKELKSLGYEN